MSKAFCFAGMLFYPTCNLPDHDHVRQYEKYSLRHLVHPSFEILQRVGLKRPKFGLSFRFQSSMSRPRCEKKRTWNLKLICDTSVVGHSTCLPQIWYNSDGVTAHKLSILNRYNYTPWIVRFHWNLARIGALWVSGGCWKIVESVRWCIMGFIIKAHHNDSVSYTHLTLPTIYSV